MPTADSGDGEAPQPSVRVESRELTVRGRPWGTAAPDVRAVLPGGDNEPAVQTTAAGLRQRYRPDALHVVATLQGAYVWVAGQLATAADLVDMMPDADRRRPLAIVTFPESTDDEVAEFRDALSDALRDQSIDPNVEIFRLDIDDPLPAPESPEADSDSATDDTR